MTSKVRMSLFLLATVAAIAISVFSAAEVQRATANQAFAEAAAAEAMLIAMLDQETGLRGYLQTGDDAFLEPYRQGRRDFERAVAQAHDGLQSGEEGEERAVSSQVAIARRWQASAEAAIAEPPARGNPRVSVAEAVERKAMMDRFRSANRELRATVARERAERQLFAEYAAVGIALMLSVLFGGVGYAAVFRPWQRVAERDRRQRRFAEQIQLTSTQGEAYGMLRRQLETSIPGAAIAVLNRNNSGDRLVAEEISDGLVVGDGVEHAPRECLAIRGGNPYVNDRSEASPLECRVCGALAAATTCVPSLVGGEVIGAVLAVRRRPLSADEVDDLTSTVSQAAPNVANLRNLEVAERRAMTDSLTGLPNSRAVQDALRRMTAHAGRTAEPLTAIMLDLDHFKAINDSHGHPRGDQVLAAVGDLLASEIRASDFVGRYGGEEFIVLLPHTSRDGGVDLAEVLRQQIEGLRLRGLGRRISASFGVAALPEDAGDWNELVRCADRALYAAKAAGRNRVTAFEKSSGVPEAVPDGL